MVLDLAFVLPGEGSRFVPEHAYDTDRAAIRTPVMVEDLRSHLRHG